MVPKSFSTVTSESLPDGRISGGLKALHGHGSKPRTQGWGQNVYMVLWLCMHKHSRVTQCSEQDSMTQKVPFRLCCIFTLKTLTLMMLLFLLSYSTCAHEEILNACVCVKSSWKGEMNELSKDGISIEEIPVRPFLCCGTTAEETIVKYILIEKFHVLYVLQALSAQFNFTVSFLKWVERELDVFQPFFSRVHSYHSFVGLPLQRTFHLGSQHKALFHFVLQQLGQRAAHFNNHL